MTTWILLRGLTRESRHWGDFVGQFQQVFPTHQILPLDLPGNGLLNLQTSPSRVDKMVEHCRVQLRQRKKEPPYNLLAMSLGAMVALGWTQMYPHEVAAQVLINTSLRRLSPFYRRLLPGNYGRLLCLLLYGAEAPDAERVILHMTSNRSDEAVLPLWLALRRANPVSTSNALRQLLAALRFQAQPEPPLALTLVLASALDQLVSPACSKSLAQHWSATLRIHPSAGHDMALDDGPWVAAQVKAWFSEFQNVRQK